jgi:hypothetical protein
MISCEGELYVLVLVEPLAYADTLAGEIPNSFASCNADWRPSMTEVSPMIFRRLSGTFTSPLFRPFVGMISIDGTTFGVRVDSFFPANEDSSESKSASDTIPIGM